MGSVRRIVTMARLGLGVMRSPGAAALAILGQCVGWMFQLLAVWSAMRAFDIHEGLPPPRSCSLLMNVATIIPLWPGNVGLVQVAIATPLVRYGVDYGKGFAFGFGLQAIEASVGVGIGLIFLGREGLSFARLREMPGAVTADDEDDAERRELRRRRRPSVSPRALACPASLKGVLRATVAAAALVRGVRRRRASTPTRCRSPTAARGRVDALCSRVRAGRDGRRVRAAADCPCGRARRRDARRRGGGGDPARPVAARRDGRVEPRARACWIARVPGPPAGRDRRRHGDDGRRRRAARGARPPARADARALRRATTLYDAPRLFGPQKGATPEQVAELEARFRRGRTLAPYADLPGSGAAGGLGAALASLGAELVPGADAVLDLLGFDPASLRPRRHRRGKRSTGRPGRGRRRPRSPAAARRRASAASSSAGVVNGTSPTDCRRPSWALSGDPARARDDLVELG